MIDITVIDINSDTNESLSQIMETKSDQYLTDVVKRKIGDAKREFRCFPKCIEDQYDIAECKEYCPCRVHYPECIRCAHGVADGNARHDNDSA